MEYQANGLVRPVDLKKNVFTTAAIDNLDHHNPRSATTESSFHGTTISVFQHADYHLSFPSFRVDANNSGRKKKASFQYHTLIFSQQFWENQNHHSSLMDLHLYTRKNGC